MKVAVKKKRKQWKEKYNNNTTMCIPVQKYKCQYKKKFRYRKIFFKKFGKNR